MNVTNNLKLPQYTEEDIFDLQDINKAYDSIDKAYGNLDDTYRKVANIKNEITKTNATAEVIDARGNKETLGERLDEFGSQLDTIETYVTPEMFKLNVELDDTNAIKKAIETGRDVELNGDYTISSKIVLNTRFQKFIQRKGFIYPTDFEDNCIEILSADNIVLVRIKGDKQTRNSNSSAIVIGDTLGVNHGANLCLDNTFIEGYKGNGIKHINGSMVSYKNVYVNSCDGHGIYLTAEAEDNHHALFINTHVVNCTGYGYYFEVSGVSDDTTNSPGVAVFENAKAYGNLENFHIETSGHYGTIFSEAGKSPDKFTETSRALSLVYLGDIVSSNNFIDSGNNNQITGTNTFKQRTDRKRYVEKIIYTTNKAGSREVSQSDNNEFLDIITDTYSEVTVKHERGSSSSRTDTFDKIKIGDCFMRCIANQKISISEAISIESGGYYKLDTNISVSASVNSIIKPFVQMNKNDDLIVSIVANRTDSGWYHPYITLFNPTKRIISLSPGTTFDFVAFS